ncbi:RrF2 family transcriptional regulator [Flavivirga rizhaonensis]|uniref:Rrf2 family transcriptional regulator n=1 Tax=Flavivirga rizhaonensis TaxID=2559571 RepID=A0A4S1DVZ7_9FLAO|nr:Rrf2 family transcriptional regulator [Flavivirga rizhaonensis]TGV02351.1 Rrf2 family transcriptional regulator [Flavivirga rizhaonensis]
MLSNSSKYAIKAVLFLALNASEKKKVMVKDISKPINVPQAYIAKLLQPLVKEGIVSSARGPRGGFYLDENNMNHSIMSIVNVIDGEKRLKSCLMSLKKCNEEKPCPLHNELSASRAQILNNLKSRMIKDLVKEVEAGNAFLPL